MAITPSRFTLGFDRAATSEAAGNRARTSLLRQGMRAAKRKGDFRTALGFSDELNRQGTPYGATGSAADVGSMAQGRVAAREALAGQMRSALAPTREGNIAAAKAAGTFDATRERFNMANQGSQTMDESGNITKVQGSQGPDEYDLELRRQNQAESDARTADARAKFDAEGTFDYGKERAAVEDYGEWYDRKKPAQMEDWLASQSKSPTTPAVDIQPAARAKGGPTTPLAASPPGPATPPADETSVSLDPRTKFTGSGFEVDLTKTAVPARAKGGPVKGGQPYLVGEEGPEIMVPEEDGKIIPNKDLKKKSRKKLSKMLSKR